MSEYKQSRKLKVHEKDINKFGKVPSLVTRLHKKMYGKFKGYRLKEDDVRVYCRYLGRSYRLPHVCVISENPCPSLTCFFSPEALVIFPNPLGATTKPLGPTWK